MKQYIEIIYSVAKIFADFLAVFLSFLIVYLIPPSLFSLLNVAPTSTLYPQSIFLTLSLLPIGIVLFFIALQEGYSTWRQKSFSQEILNALKGASIGFLILLCISVFREYWEFWFITVTCVAIITPLFLIFWRFTLKIIFNTQCFSRFKKRIILIDPPPHWSTYHKTHNILTLFQVVKITKTPKSMKDSKILSKEITKTMNMISDYNADVIVFSLNKSNLDHSQKLLEKLHEQQIPVGILWNMKNFIKSKFPVIDTHGQYISFMPTNLYGWNSVLKTTIDMFFGLLVLVILSPIFIITALIIFISEPKAPVIYVSQRIGRNGKKFNFYKFRSMIPGAESEKQKLMQKNERKDKILFKMKDDPRITKIGKVIRRWSIDELPQVFNILKGEMSFIGPRPHLPEEIAKYPKSQLKIFFIKPGISGYAQINGRSALDFYEESRYDLQYLKQWSLWLDIRVLFQTIRTIIKGDNAT